MSYRIRGNVPRIQINKTARNLIFAQTKRSDRGVKGEAVVKMAVENILIAKILVYSAIKMRAKGPLLYSVLKPDTSSDSPSAWSKGVRFVSASIVINHIKNTGKIISRGQEYEWKERLIKLKFCIIRRALNRIKAILTS